MSPSRRPAVTVNGHLRAWWLVNVNTITACGRTPFGATPPEARPTVVYDRVVRISLGGWRLGGFAVAATLAMATPAGAQEQVCFEADLSDCEFDFTGSPFVNPQPDSGLGGFAAVFVLVLVLGLGVTAFRYLAVRDMAQRRGLSDRDASTAALFGEDAAIAGLVLRDETEAPDEPTAAATPPTASLRARLDIVESLRADGAISDDEAERRRAEILREI